MRKYSFLCLSFFLIYSENSGQLRESFDDGDFTRNPTWIGDTAAFFVNDDLQLQSRSRAPNTTFYLSTENALISQTGWQFWLRAAFNTSSLNYIDVFLTSREANLLSASNTGYFVRVGGANDEIALFRKDGQGKNIKIIGGKPGLTNAANNLFQIRVTRDAPGNWRLYLDQGATGQFEFTGSANDSTYQDTRFFGIAIAQSTSGFFEKHFFDDFVIEEWVPDLTPPALDTVVVLDSHNLILQFNKPLHRESALSAFHYSVLDFGMPQRVEMVSSKAVRLHFEQPFQSRFLYQLLVKDVAAESGSSISSLTASFLYSVPLRYDVLITEIFFDPVPSAGLPQAKFIELYNRSAFPVNVGGWRISVGSRHTVLPAFTLMPAGYVVLTSGEGASAYRSYGDVLAVPAFPNLPVEGALIHLMTGAGETMHATEYSPAIIENAVKRQGGWSLEMIDPSRGCSDTNNWQASDASIGGTPGKQNSVNGKAEGLGPAVVHAYAKDSALHIVFTQTLDSAKVAAQVKEAYPTGTKAEVLPPLFKEIRVSDVAVEAERLYEFQIPLLTGCNGSSTGPISVKYGLPQLPEPGDVVINEILFNPLPHGTDYVELFNRSGKVIDGKALRLANRSSAGAMGNGVAVSEKDMPVYPGEYVLLSADSKAVLSQYVTRDVRAFHTLKSFPSYPNVQGNVLLLDRFGRVLEEVAYHEKWHSSFVKDARGVALERIDANAAAGPDNFQSAAASAGYGTPGYRNSQAGGQTNFTGEIGVEPKVFTPDGDGTDDFVLIRYRYPRSGTMSDVKIFDAGGRLVKYLQKNSISGTEGFFKWDGNDDKNRPLPQGVYVIFTRAFHPGGKVKEFKNTVVLGRR